MDQWTVGLFQHWRTEHLFELSITKIYPRKCVTAPRLSVPSNGYEDIVRRILSGMYPRLKGCSVKGAVRGTRVPRSRVSGVRR